LLHLTEQQAKKYNSPESKKEIDHFIKFHQLNVEEILEPIDSFKNFKFVIKFLHYHNFEISDFFYRKLKKSARAIAAPDNNKLAVSPADSRLNVFATISDAQRIW
jgi:phosphatidylserine decarboxylase